MNRGWQILIAVGVVALGGIAFGEHRSRRSLEGRYRQAVETRRQLELQFGEFRATHQQLQQDLASERQHSKELSEELASMRGRLEEASGRLAEESRSVHELQIRLASIQQQMGRLQGELAVRLQDSNKKSLPQGESPVQLQRILVSDADASGLTGRIISVHKDWNFVVVNFGWDEVRIGDTISIFRGDQLLAKARVDRVQEEFCAATILPEWQTAEIQVNDFVKPL